MKTNYNLSITFTTCMLLIFNVFFVSCKKDGDEKNFKPGISKLNITASISDFSTSNDILKNASASPLIAAEEIITNTIELNKDLNIVATFEEDKNNTIGSKLIKQASSNLGNGIWYKLLVFKKADGTFVIAKDFKRGEENNNSNPIKLDGGVEYTFVAYSANSTNVNDLPSYSSSTLSNSTININTNTELLYFKKDHIISGEAEDNLSIVFKRQYSQVTTIINTTGADNIAQVASYFDIPKNQATFNLNTGVANWSGTTTKKQSNAYTITGKTATSITNLLAEDGQVDFALEKLVVGTNTFDATNGGTPKKPLNKLKLQPGKRYTLTLNVNPIINNFNFDCSQGTLAANLGSDTPKRGIRYQGTISIPYTGGNGTSYPETLITPTPVNGMTVKLKPGQLTNSTGNLIFDITGIPTESKETTIPIDFGGKHCDFKFNVTTQSGDIVSGGIIPYTFINGEVTLMNGSSAITVTTSGSLNYVSGVVRKNIANTNQCGLGDGDWYIGYNNTTNIEITFKFSKPVKVFRVTQTGTNSGEVFRYNAKYQGNAFNVGLFGSYSGTCGSYGDGSGFTLSGNRVTKPSDSNQNYTGIRYEVRPYGDTYLYFDELTITYTQPRASGSLVEFEILEYVQ